MRREFVLAILFALTACGWWWFGPNSVGTAILATPLLGAISLLLVATVNLSGALLASRRVGASPFILHLGPLEVTWAARGVRLGMQRRTDWFGGMLAPTMRAGKHDSAPEAHAAGASGMAFTSLAIAALACVLLYLCLRNRLGPLPTWGAFVLTAASVHQLIRSATLIGSANRSLADDHVRQRILAANAVNTAIREGQRPGTWPIDVVDGLADAESSELPGIAEMHYLAYYALLDRGNVVAAGDRIDAASDAALQAIRSGKHDVQGLARIFVEMAYFTAFHRGHAEQARAWLDLCVEAWLDPGQRRRAEAAIHFAAGDLPAARALAERVHRDELSDPALGDALAQADWAAEIVRACDGEPQRPESILARGRSIAVPPLVVNCHGGTLVYRWVPWLCLSGSLLLFALAGDLIQRHWDEDGVIWAGGASALALILGFVGILAYLVIAHSWIEVTRDGVGYALARKLQWLEWSRFRGSGRVARAPFSPSGLILMERVTLKGARGPAKQLGGVPLSTFSPDWRETQLGATIHLYAPHLLTTKAQPTGWLS
jgi:hypothetical protein